MEVVWAAVLAGWQIRVEMVEARVMVSAVLGSVAVAMDVVAVVEAASDQLRDVAAFALEVAVEAGKLVVRTAVSHPACMLAGPAGA